MCVKRTSFIWRKQTLFHLFINCFGWRFPYWYFLGESQNVATLSTLNMRTQCKTTSEVATATKRIYAIVEELAYQTVQNIKYILQIKLRACNKNISLNYTLRGMRIPKPVLLDNSVLLRSCISSVCRAFRHIGLKTSLKQPRHSLSRFTLRSIDLNRIGFQWRSHQTDRNVIIPT